MAATWETVRRAIHKWAYTSSGLAANKVIWAKQDRPRPAYPYVAMLVTSDKEHGQPTKRETYVPEDDVVVVTLTQQYDFVVRFSAYATTETATEGANVYLRKMRIGLGLPEQKDAFSAADTAFVRVLSFLDVSEVGSGQYLSRWDMDVTFSAMVETTTTQQFIETVETTATLDNQTYSEEISVGS